MTHPPASRHVLLLGGMRHLHRPLLALPDVRTTLVIPPRKAKADDTRLHQRVLYLPDLDTELLALALALHSVDPVTHVICFDDHLQALAGRAAQALGLPYHSGATIHAVNNKGEMRRVLQAAGVGRPLPCAQVRTEADLAAFAQTHGYPLILKPVDGQGSTGIARLDSPSDIPGALAYTTRESGRPGGLVEPFVTGQEYSVEALSQGGEHWIVAITQKFKDERTFVEVGHLLPAALPDDERRVLETFTRQALTALGVQSGPTHTELILGERGPQLIETHLRLGGDFIPEMVEDALGVPLVELSIRAQLGEAVLTPPPSALRASWSGIWFRTSDAHGTVDRIDPPPAQPGVVRAECLAAPGSAAVPTRNSFQRLFAAQAVADSPGAALRLAQHAAACAVIRIQPTPQVTP